MLPTLNKHRLTCYVRLSGGESASETTRHYSVHALTLLGELLATLLDVTFRSEEKERIVPYLVNLMLKVFPYLRNHT